MVLYNQIRSNSIVYFFFTRLTKKNDGVTLNTQICNTDVLLMQLDNGSVADYSSWSLGAFDLCNTTTYMYFEGQNKDISVTKWDQLVPGIEWSYFLPRIYPRNLHNAYQNKRFLCFDLQDDANYTCGDMHQLSNLSSAKLGVLYFLFFFFSLNFFSGRGVRPGFLKYGACELTFASEKRGLWAGSFQIYGLVSWKLPNLGACELKISKFGGLWAKIWVKIEAVEAKISKVSQKGVLWTDSFAWNGTLASGRRGVKRGSSGPHIPITPF